MNDQSIPHSGSGMVTIYALVDPREPERVRYVGKSVNLVQRLYRHGLAANAGKKWPVSGWIRELMADGIRPSAVILSAITPDRWQDDEQFFIAVYGGPDLLNVMPGGEGLTSEIARARWTDPEFRDRMKAAFTDPAFRARHSAAMKAAYADPERRARLSAIGKATWTDPEYRERRITAFANSEAGARMRTGLKAARANPAFRARHSAATSAACADPKVKARRGAVMKARWTDPAFRARRIVAMKAIWTDPEYRTRMSAERKERWEDVEFRARRSTAMKAYHARRRAAKAAADAGIQNDILDTLENDNGVA